MPETNNMTLLGFDYGTKRIGVAVGQTLTGTASPLTTLYSKNTKPDWAAISKLIEEWKPQELVVGLPYNMDDTEAEVAENAKRFARQLEGRYHIKVHMVDERLTSLEAERYIDPKSDKSHQVDAAAAAFILETWLNP